MKVLSVFTGKDGIGPIVFRLPMSDKLRASCETLILPKLQLGVTVGVQFCGTVLTVYEF